MAISHTNRRGSTMKETITKIAATAAVALTATACVPMNTAGSPVTRSKTAPAQTISEVDPLSENGTWLVPEEIQPGTYRVAVTGAIGGYSEVCADAECQIGTSGFISNDLYNGPGVLVIPQNAVTVKLNGITLTPMADR